ncbi:hypothetical protein ACDP63_24615 [Paracoccus sp. P2]|uniref:hypothetical protein n=1 Tax=Paracoccus sp. P2 TaxID=3248840 RepID=UPI00391EFB60
MAGVRGTRLIPSLEAAYLKAAIESGKNERAKRALQALCKMYWNGARLQAKDRNGLENTVLGALTRGNSSEKVRRWSLTSLAQFGKANVSWEAVLASLKKHQTEPQVVSAAIAAAFKLKPQDAHTELLAMDFVSAEILALSALQSVPSDVLSSGIPVIEVDQADATTLKLALVLVGLGRAPENLFHPAYINGDLVRALGSHHEPLVCQYSIWATAENPTLSVKDLGIDPRSVESRPPNVRSYVYRLFAAERSYSELQHLLIEVGSRDSDPEARMGCAIGLRDTWYDGIEPIVCDWLLSEEEQEIQRYLLDHLVRQAPKSTSYASLTIELFENFQNDTEARQVMMIAASGGPLFRDLKLIELKEDQGFLYSKGQSMGTTNNNITINNHGSMGQTSISGSGSAASDGKVQAQVQAGVPEIIRSIRELLVDMPKQQTIDQELAVELEQAEADPSPGRLQRLVALLERLKGGLEAAGDSLEAATALGGKIALLALAAGIGG